MTSAASRRSIVIATAGNDGCVFLYAFELIELNGHDLWRDLLVSDVCVIVWPVGEFSWTAAICRNSAARSRSVSRAYSCGAAAASFTNASARYQYSSGVVIRVPRRASSMER